MNTFDVREWKKKLSKPKKLINEMALPMGQYGAAHDVKRVVERLKGLADEPSALKVWKKTKDYNAVWDELVRLAIEEMDKEVKYVEHVTELQKREMKRSDVKPNTISWLKTHGPLVMRPKDWEKRQAEKPGIKQWGD